MLCRRRASEEVWSLVDGCCVYSIRCSADKWHVCSCVIHCTVFRRRGNHHYLSHKVGLAHAGFIVRSDRRKAWSSCIHSIVIAFLLMMNCLYPLQVNKKIAA
jgi:hypothetical protein